MRFIILLIILTGSFWYSASYLMEHKPTWFLELVAGMPFVNSEVDMAFDESLSSWTEDDVQTKYSNLLLACEADTTGLGDQACFAVITRFNSVTANNIVFYFDESGLNSLRVAYPAEQHESILNYLNSISRNHRFVPGSVEKQGQALGMWVVKGGIIATFEERPINNDEGILNWNSHTKFMRYQYTH